MKLGNIFRGPKWPRDAAEFIATHFADKSVTEFFDEPRFERFLYLAKTEAWDVPVSESVGQGVSSWGGERAKLAEICCWYGLQTWWAGIRAAHHLACRDYTDKPQPTKLEALQVWR